MTIRFANIKKFASGAAIAAAIAGAGLGLGFGTAQADTPNPDLHHVVVRIFDHANQQIGLINDRFVDRFDRRCAFIDRRINRHLEGSLLDRFVDHACGTM